MTEQYSLEYNTRNTANRLETAVNQGDTAAYAAVMNDINKVRKENPEAYAKSYIDSVMKKLEEDKILPTVALFESKQSLPKIDTDGNGKLTRAELDAYANRRDVNDLQSNLIGNVVKNYNQIRDYKTHWENWHGGNSDNITKADVEQGYEQQRALNNLFARNKDGASLYDRITNKDGNIEPGKIKTLLKLDQENPGKWLTKGDVQTLKVLNDNKSLWQTLAPWADDQKKGDLQQLSRKNGTSVEEMKKQMPGSRDINAELKQTVVVPGMAKPTATAPEMAEQKAVAPDTAKQRAIESESTKPNVSAPETARPVVVASGEHSAPVKVDKREREEKIKEALTVRSGESYWHSAERLMELAGHSDPSAAQLKKLSHQLWLADHRRKANGLKSRQVLTLSEEIRRNSSVSTLFE